VGKIILTAGQFAWCPALAENPHKYVSFSKARLKQGYLFVFFVPCGTKGYNNPLHSSLNKA